MEPVCMIYFYNTIKGNLIILKLYFRGVVYYGMVVGKLPFQPVYKVGINPVQKRKYLLEEVKQGMTIKQLKEIKDCSSCKIFRTCLPYLNLKLLFDLKRRILLL